VAFRTQPQAAEGPPHINPVEGSCGTTGCGCRAAGSERKKNISAALSALRVPLSALFVSPDA